MESRNAVYIGLGTNLGEREATLAAAVRMLGEEFERLQSARVYESEPQYDREQPRFLNTVVQLRTSLGPLGVLERLLAIERAFGRKRDAQRPKGPRTLDLDLLLYRDWIVRHPRLTVPHPGVRERVFVLLPLLELCPGARDPITGREYRHDLDRLSLEGIYPISG